MTIGVHLKTRLPGGEKEEVRKEREGKGREEKGKKEEGDCLPECGSMVGP